MDYKLLNPEVAGSIGSRSVIDTTVNPPKVSRLHYEFDGWIGDELLESFPCFIVTSRVKDAIEESSLSGCIFDVVEVSTSDQFTELYPRRILPLFYWLKVEGNPGDEDFGVSADQRLVVSEKAMDLLQRFRLENCDVTDFQ